jgi:hypothetical protein
VKKCDAIKTNGGRCERIVSDSQRYCYAHDPANAERRKQAASRAAKSKNAASELVEIKARIRQLSDDVASGKLATAKGSVAGQLLGIYLKAIEQERKIKETQEFEERLAALEKATQHSYGSVR